MHVAFRRNHIGQDAKIGESASVSLVRGVAPDTREVVALKVELLRFAQSRFGYVRVFADERIAKGRLAELLARRSPALTRVTAQASRQSFWNCWLSTHLPPELHPRISGVTERDGTLVIFAETAAWSARLRYALLELEGEIRAADPALTDIEVRVLPRG